MWRMITLEGVGLVRFHGNINTCLYKKNFFISMLFLTYAKGQMKLQYLCKTYFATKLELC